LSKSLASGDNVTVVNKDILKIDPVSLLQDSRGKIPTVANAGYKVVANLPYYITSPVLRYFLEASVKPEIIVVMVQQEVAESITAGPGRMSLLGVSVQLYGEPGIVDIVPARCFYPSPEVDSAILKIVPYAQPVVAINDREVFFSVVRAGFSTSRKQLVNSLALGLGVTKPEVLSILAGAGISPQRRAETLTMEEWVRLYRAFRAENEGRC
jgi:16S rRNA (adenine1518-N6/adenine1519-N6)-dimethyltransferase